MTEALPALQNIFLEGLQPSGPVQKAIGEFVAARKVTNNPISVNYGEGVWGLGDESEDKDEDDDGDHDDKGDD